MVDKRMALIDLIEKQADTDLAREMLVFVANLIMGLEMELRTGAEKGTLCTARGAAQWISGVGLGYQGGRIAQEIPKLRKGSQPTFPETTTTRLSM